MVRRRARSTLFPTRRSSDLLFEHAFVDDGAVGVAGHVEHPHVRAQAGQAGSHTRLNSSHANNSYADYCLKKEKAQADEESRAHAGRPQHAVSGHLTPQESTT